jgi:hypothetical protein
MKIGHLLNAIKYIATKKRFHKNITGWKKQPVSILTDKVDNIQRK